MKQVLHIMDKYLFTKRTIFTSWMIVVFLLSGCVTQNYENNDTPVVQNQANRDDMAATRVSLGLGYLKMGNMPQAKQNLEKAKKFAPDMVQVYTAFAHYYETVGEHELTIESYEKALSIKSDDADTLNNYGVYLCRQDEVDEAEKQFLKAIAVPSYVLVAKSYENLSACFLQKDDFNKTEMYLKKAILHNPNRSSTLFQMIQLQYAMGEYKQAKSFQQRFEKVSRRFTSQSLALAYKVYFKLGQRRTAKNYGTMLVKMHPQSWESQQYLLNELELIEADNLAKRYQKSQASNTEAKSKKRIVKLSPKKDTKVTKKPKVVEKPAKQIISKQAGEKASSTAPQDKELQPNSVSDKIQEKQVVMSDKLNADQPSIIKAKEDLNEKTKETSEKLNQKNKAAPQKFPDFHIVEAGETLYSISVKYNIKIKALRKWNKIYKNKKLHIKDIIFLENPKLVNQ